MFRTCTKIVLILAVLACFTWISASTQSASTQPASILAGSTRLDAATMKAALHTTLIEEGGFIDDLLIKVNRGTLPADMVDSTFQWARKKPVRHRFQYFKQAMIVRAASIGIILK